MNIELKNVKFYERMSEETNCFVADLYINGVKMAYVKNDGHGGSTNVQPYKDYKSLKPFFDFCENQPSIKYNDFTLEMTADLYVDNLFENWLKEKDSKKMKKQFEKGIVYAKTPTLESSYNIVSWKNKSLSEVIQLNPTAVKKVINDLKGKGFYIFNPNLPKGF